jgi:uncharacterized protein
MRSSRRWAAAAWAALACAPAAVPARAQLQLPPPVGYVNDFAHRIDPAYRDSILAVIDDVREKCGGEIVVVTLPSLQGRSRDEVALQIGREWKVGQKGEPGDPMRNTGTIVLVSMQDRQLKIELGDRTNTFITAAEAGRIRDLMVPELPRSVGRGIYLGVVALAEKYAQQFRFELAPSFQPSAPEYQPAPDTYDDGGERGGNGQWVIFVLFILLFLLTRGRIGCLPLFFMGGGGGRGGGWGGGGFGGGGGGGGFGGFGGGGGFSGGGSGGDW